MNVTKYQILVKINLIFSSNGAGEELDFIVNSNVSSGYYVAISYSKFGGISFAVIKNR